MKVNTNKRVLIIIAVIGFAILLLIPKNAPNISNALVNEENGDIVFLFGE